ncbi:1-acyl-sn-glycerol-3-phosphate acyltransferase, partial [Nitrospinae bacterium AH_259_B05_G02_I21]|nr:1-acyl-sn-glycerol-3-phosphate acyltransferase [Nitrospinae bacterium AH_259_B05_G02_I21]
MVAAAHIGMAVPLTFLHKIWIFISIVVVNFLLRLVARVEVQGRENIPLDGGVLFVANHTSAYDVLLIPPTVLPRWPLTSIEYVRAPANEIFFRIPIIGTIIHSWGAFPIQHSGRDLSSMGRIVELMKTEKMMLFPEGARSHDGQLQPGMRSVGWLIHQAQPLVIPTAIFGTEKVWPRERLLPRPYGRVRLVFGKPLNLDRYYDQPLSKALAQQVVDEVMAAIAHLKMVHR